MNANGSGTPPRPSNIATSSMPYDDHTTLPTLADLVAASAPEPRTSRPIQPDPPVEPYTFYHNGRLVYTTVPAPTNSPLYDRRDYIALLTSGHLLQSYAVHGVFPIWYSADTGHDTALYDALLQQAERDGHRELALWLRRGLYRMTIDVMRSVPRLPYRGAAAPRDALERFLEHDAARRRQERRPSHRAYPVPAGMEHDYWRRDLTVVLNTGWASRSG